MTIKSTFLAVFLSLLALLATPSLHAVDPPGILNHQGSVSVGGTKYSGPGYFKFALLSQPGPSLRWSNSNFNFTTQQPDSAVSATVTGGNYAITLGDTDLPNMAAIPASVFTDYADIELRIWFSTSPGGPYTRLSPDRRVAPAGYAFSATSIPGIDRSSGVISKIELGDSSQEGAWRVEQSGPQLNVSVTDGGGGVEKFLEIQRDTTSDSNRMFIRGVTSAESIVATGISVPNSGKIKIGGFIQEVDPARAPLDVSTSSSVLLTTYFYLNGSTGYGGPHTPANPEPVSILADSIVSAGAFTATSDERIKEITGVSDGTEDLGILLDIEVTDYTYKDKVAKGIRSQKKVIAQQVETVYPQAVSRTTDVVPDIYRKASIEDGWVKLGTDLKAGERIKIITKTGAHLEEVLDVSGDAFRIALETGEDEVFVYGREVDDFRTVDYEAISMLNVSATQELHRQLEAEQAKNAALEKRLAALEAKDALRDATLTRLEKLLGNGGTKLVSLDAVGAGE